jgi:hypothetical protein
MIQLHYVGTFPHIVVGQCGSARRVCVGALGRDAQICVGALGTRCADLRRVLGRDVKDVKYYASFYARRMSQTTRTIKRTVPRRPPPIYIDISLSEVRDVDSSMAHPSPSGR